MKKNGFTLIELMVVMLVISILISVALPRIKGMQDEANVSKAKSELETIQLAIESYYIHQSPKAYPASSTTISATTLNSATPLIVGEVLTDPFAPSGTEYNYFLSDNGLYYVVFSLGVDGEAEVTGIDDNGNIAGTENDDLYVTNGFGFE